MHVGWLSAKRLPAQADGNGMAPIPDTAAAAAIQSCCGQCFNEKHCGAACNRIQTGTPAVLNAVYATFEMIIPIRLSRSTGCRLAGNASRRRGSCLMSVRSRHTRARTSYRGVQVPRSTQPWEPQPPGWTWTARLQRPWRLARHPIMPPRLCPTALPRSSPILCVGSQYFI